LKRGEFSHSGARSPPVSFVARNSAATVPSGSAGAALPCFSMKSTAAASVQPRVFSRSAGSRWCAFRGWNCGEMDAVSLGVRRPLLDVFALPPRVSQRICAGACRRGPCASLTPEAEFFVVNDLAELHRARSPPLTRRIRDGGRESFQRKREAQAAGCDASRLLGKGRFAVRRA